MAPVPYRLWAPLLLAFVFLASDNKGAELKGFQVIRQNGPWISPRGDSDTAVSCTALEKLVGQLETEKQETTTLNSQLENEVSVLRKDLTHLRTQVATCGSSGSPAHQIQVQKKMKQYLETFDGETFLILKILSLTREVMRLQMKLSRALNSTDASKSQTVSVLQKEVKDKTAELDALKRQLQGLQGKDLSQIYQIILLQNRIWNVDQLGGAQAKSELTALQSQLDAKLRQLQSKDAAAAMLELISVQGKIGRVEQLMSTYIEESRDNYAAREIFRLQSEVDEAQKMMNSFESALQTLLQAREEELSKAQAEVKGKSAATDKNTHSVEHTPGWAFSSSQNCGESCRPRRKPPTSVSRLSDQRPEDPSSTFDFWFPPSPETQAEFDQAVAALTRKGESETADVLSVIRLQEEITALSDLITRTRDQNKLLELETRLSVQVETCLGPAQTYQRLQGDLQAKMEELQSKSDTVTSLDLESKVEEFQQQIKDKTQMMDSSNVRVSDLSAAGSKSSSPPLAAVEIMELHRGIAAMKDQISRLEEENANKVKGLTKRLELSQRKLKDAELLFQEANSKYSEMVMEIIDVKEQLKKAQALASKVAEKPQDPGLEQEIETLKKENRRLETASADLKQQVQELNACCGDFSSQCEDIERQLQQSIKDADYIHQQISKKEQRIAELMEELQEKGNQTDSLVDQVERLNGERQRLHDIIEELRENLSEKEERTIIAKSITMDPNTAHPRVALAEDNTELYTLAESRDVPDHPGRYDVVLATLAPPGSPPADAHGSPSPGTTRGPGCPPGLQKWPGFLL
ncbi:unnamed protein product [Tetraodon nigroviridis]|uniref:(spotted green pufferfish) hypothetical protein n=1 Tax=Tetraodon nigroviridis TaxID=99883 RepID=Q4SNS7_TETNG|nr:unnamed protein product [Tetraodon nigroviridis]